MADIPSVKYSTLSRVWFRFRSREGQAGGDNYTYYGLSDITYIPEVNEISGTFELFSAGLYGKSIFGVIDSSLELMDGYVGTSVYMECSFEFLSADITGSISGANVSGEFEQWNVDIYSAGSVSSDMPTIVGTMYGSGSLISEFSEFYGEMLCGGIVSDELSEWSNAYFEEIDYSANLTTSATNAFINHWSTRWYDLPMWDLEIDYGITSYFSQITGAIVATYDFDSNITDDTECWDAHIFSGANLSAVTGIFDGIFSPPGFIYANTSSFDSYIYAGANSHADAEEFFGVFLAGSSITDYLQLWNGAFYDMSDITAALNQWSATFAGIYAFNSMYADMDKFTAESLSGAAVNGSATMLDRAVFDVFFGQSLGVAAYFARLDSELYAGAIAKTMSLPNMAGELSGTVTHVNRIYTDAPLWGADIEAYLDGSGDVDADAAQFNSSITGAVINPATITDSFELFGFSGRSSQESSTELVAEFIRFSGTPVFVGRDTSPADIDCDFEEFTGDGSSGMSCASVDTVAANIEYEAGVSF